MTAAGSRGEEKGIGKGGSSLCSSVFRTLDPCRTPALAPGREKTSELDGSAVSVR